MMIVMPLMTKLPVRGMASGLGATEKVTLPLPKPAGGTVSQAVVLFVSQLQSALPVSVTVALPPPDSTVTVCAATENPQPPVTLSVSA